MTSFKETVNTPAFERAFYRVAVAFLTRKGEFFENEREIAVAEIDNILEKTTLEALAESATTPGQYENDEYVLRVSRIGLYNPPFKTMNRVKKVSIAMSLNNALNHAYYEVTKGAA